MTVNNPISTKRVIQWASWTLPDGGVALKWEFKELCSLWFAVWQANSSETPLAIWHGSVLGKRVRDLLSGKQGVSVDRAGTSYQKCGCPSVDVLDLLHTEFPSGRILLLPGTVQPSRLSECTLNEAFSLPDSLSPVVVEMNNWQAKDRLLVTIFDVPLASLLFWDGDHVDVHSRTCSEGEIQGKFIAQVTQLDLWPQRVDAL